MSEPASPERLEELARAMLADPAGPEDLAQLLLTVADAWRLHIIETPDPYNGPYSDPNPDCPGEFHGADGGACQACGWDSHPIP